MTGRRTCQHGATALDYRGECLTCLYARLNARVARGECYWCATPGVADGDWCPGCGATCPTCHAPITGAMWGTRGECLACYETLRVTFGPDDFGPDPERIIVDGVAL